MLLLHLSPITKTTPATPWFLEYLVIDDNTLQPLNTDNEPNSGSFAIALPAGKFPCIPYVLAYLQDYSLVITRKAISYQEAGNRLIKLLAQHEHIVFSHQQSRMLFAELMNMCLLPNLLAQKKISSLTTIVRVASYLRQLYPQENVVSLNKMASFLNLPRTPNKCQQMLAILQNLQTRAPKLLHYFLQQTYTIQYTNLQPHQDRKLFIYFTDKELSLLALLKQTAHDIIAIDLLELIKHHHLTTTIPTVDDLVLLSLTDTGVISPANTIPTSILQQLGTDAKEVTQNLQQLNTFLNSPAGQALYHDEVNTESIALFDTPVWLELVESRSNLQELSDKLLTIPGMMRELAFDYIFNVNASVLSYQLNMLYSQLVTDRIKSCQFDFMNEFEHTYARASASNKKSL